MGLDIGVLKSADLNHASCISPVRDAKGDPYPDVSITVVSIDSDRYRDFKRKTGQAQLDKVVTFGRLRPQVDEVNEEIIDTLVACTVEWTGFEKDGEPLPPTPENVRAVYKAAPWIRDQVNLFMGDRRNFFSASANGSAKQ
jgi:hypothetical protein